MKALFITLSLLFAAVAGTVYAANEKDPQVSEIRKVEAFSSVEVTSVATVYFTQGNNYSLKIEGREEYVTTTTTEVKNDCLIIGFKNKYELPVVKNLCPADGHTKRQEVKELIRELNRKNPGVKERMLTAVLNGNIFDWPERFIGRSEQ